MDVDNSDYPLSYVFLLFFSFSVLFLPAFVGHSCFHLNFIQTWIRLICEKEIWNVEIFLTESTLFSFSLSYKKLLIYHKFYFFSFLPTFQCFTYLIYPSCFSFVPSSLYIYIKWRRSERKISQLLFNNKF